VAVVVADDRHLVRYRDAEVACGGHEPDGAVVVERGHRRWHTVGQQVLCGALAVVLGESSWDQPDLVPQTQVAHRGAVAAATLGRSGGPLPVHVDDRLVSEAGEVLHGQPGTGDVVAADHVHRPRAKSSGHHDDRHALGELLDRRPRQSGAQQHHRFAAVVEQ